MRGEGTNNDGAIGRWGPLPTLGGQESRYLSTNSCASLMRDVNFLSSNRLTTLLLLFLTQGSPHAEHPCPL